MCMLLLNDVLEIMIPRKSLILLLVAVGFVVSLSCLAFAQSPPEPTLKPLPFVSTIFGDNMVLQRGKKNTIWGWSDPGDKVRVEIAGKHASGVAGPDGGYRPGYPNKIPTNPWFAKAPGRRSRIRRTTSSPGIPNSRSINPASSPLRFMPC